jgi:hypothetical protein
MSLRLLSFYVVSIFIALCIITVVMPIYMMYREKVKRFHLLSKDHFWSSPVQKRSVLQYELYYSPISEHSILAVTSIWGRRLSLIVGKQDRAKYSRQHLKDLSQQIFSLLDRHSLRVREFLLCFVSLYLITVSPVKLLPPFVYNYLHPIVLSPVYQVLEKLVTELPLIRMEMLNESETSLLKQYFMVEEANYLEVTNLNFSALIALGLRITNFDYMRQFRLSRVKV